ncbi:beta strand repeat-containing protein, partial [Helicobacter pullorum]
QKPLNNQSLETKNPKNAKGLDSKSKLESKNPNKIQTAKIQDSKASKDSIKLESNSPKLKDSKVSKTSKDSMKLESSPKLDSKTSQKSNKESESKQAKKIQRAKTCDSKKPTKSKNSSKLKSFIRTIPISIALASALSSQAVADWSTDGGACSSGDFNCTISKDLNLTSTRGNIQIVATGNVGTLTIDSGYNVAKVLNSPFGDNGIFSIQGTAEGLTNNGTITAIGSWRNIVVGAENKTSASIGNIVNNGTMVSINTNMLLHGRVDSIVNSGTIILNSGTNQAWSSVFAIENQVGADLTFSDQSLTQSTTNYKNIIWTQDRRATSLGNIVAKDNARLEGNFDFNNRFTGESIIFQDSANMTGNISLAGNSAITNGITIGGNSSGGSGNNASLTGNISLAGSSSISKILIDGSNMGGSGINGTPKLQGNITLNASNGITNGITIANGGTMQGNINAQSSSSIGGIAINNGSLIGSISLTNTSNITGGINVQNGGTITNNISAVGGARIDSINITDGRVGGNISANWSSAGNGIGTINQITITDGEVGGNIELANKNTMTNGMTLNNGTINGAINLNIGTADGSMASIPTIFLQNASTIANITLGNSATDGGQGYIDSLTLGGTSSIGSIVNNRGTISSIALNGASTITNGITNASGGTISNITLASSNTIHNGIANEGNIGTITSNTNDGV